MPIPMESRDLSENQQPSDFILSQIREVLEYGDDSIMTLARVDETVRDVSLGQIDEYMKKIQLDQDLPFELTRIRAREIKDEKTFKAICEHYSIYDVPFNPLLHTKVYFIETSDNAVVFTPIELEKGLINFSVELLDRENTIPEIYSLYMGLGKMKMSDIKFVKFNK